MKFSIKRVVGVLIAAHLTKWQNLLEMRKMFGLKFAIPAVGFIIASLRRNPITPNEINLATKRRNRALDVCTEVLLDIIL